MFATGIENSYPTISLPDGKTLRVDEMEKCGHYKHWREDFQLVKDLGIEFLRYGPPYYSTHIGPHATTGVFQTTHSPRFVSWRSHRLQTCATLACPFG